MVTKPRRWSPYTGSDHDDHSAGQVFFGAAVAGRPTATRPFHAGARIGGHARPPLTVRALHPLLRAPWALAVGTARLAARLAPPGDGKLVRSLRARRGLLDRIRRDRALRDPTRPLVWLHAPSVGEGLQARPVLQALRAAHPDWQLAYTWFSPSADRFAASLEVDMRSMLPFDGVREAETLLDTWQPDVLAYVKLDVWPTLTAQAARRDVRVALLSATLAETSGRRGPLARALLGDAYAALEAVGAISREDADRLVALGTPPERIAVTGDTRMDQVWMRCAGVGEAHPVRRLHAPGAGPMFVAGSTWPADEAVLLPAIAAWCADSPAARVIIAPHEPTAAHLVPIETWARAAGLPLARLSDAESHVDPSSGWRVLLVDRVGVLGDLYALADAAFVGGGFHDAGLHSVLEPAAFGVPVLFGPRHRNAREAGDLLRTGGAQVVTDAATLAAALRILETSPDARNAAGRSARALVEAGRGSTARVLSMIERLVHERRSRA